MKLEGLHISSSVKKLKLMTIHQRRVKFPLRFRTPLHFFLNRLKIYLDVQSAKREIFYKALILSLRITNPYSSASNICEICRKERTRRVEFAERFRIYRKPTHFNNVLHERTGSLSPRCIYTVRQNKYPRGSDSFSRLSKNRLTDRLLRALIRVTRLVAAQKPRVSPPWRLNNAAISCPAFRARQVKGDAKREAGRGSLPLPRISLFLSWRVKFHRIIRHRRANSRVSPVSRN